MTAIEATIPHLGDPHPEPVWKDPNIWRNRPGGTWLIYGSSLSGPEYLDRALDITTPGCVCTCNAGIHDLPRADYYGIFEMNAPNYWSRFYQKSRASGTKLITSTAAVRNMPEMSLERKGSDIVLDAEHYPGSEDKPGFSFTFRRGLYTGGVPSGAHMTQFAINKGAGAVLLVGMEGYASTPSNKVVDTIDGRMGPNLGEKFTRTVYGPFMQAMVSACPDVFFMAFGKLRYPLVGKNVIVIH